MGRMMMKQKKKILLLNQSLLREWKKINISKQQRKHKMNLPFLEKVLQSHWLAQRSRKHPRLEEAKLEKVILKAHAFEKDPQDTPEEMPAKVKVGKPLKVLTSDETEKKKDTVVV